MNAQFNHTIAQTSVWETVDFSTLKQVFGMRIQNRAAADVQVSYIAAGTVYWTVKSGAVKELNWNSPKSPQLYVNGTATNVIEIEVLTTT